MLWLEVLLSVIAGLLLGGLLLGGRSRLSGASAVALWLVVALGAAVVVMLYATEPVLDVAIAVVVAVVVAVAGAPWVVGRSDARLQALPYWSRMRADARLRADAARHAARAEQSDPPHRDLSTPDPS